MMFSSSFYPFFYVVVVYEATSRLLKSLHLATTPFVNGLDFPDPVHSKIEFLLAASIISLALINVQIIKKTL